MLLKGTDLEAKEMLEDCFNNDFDTSKIMLTVLRNQLRESINSNDKTNEEIRKLKQQLKDAEKQRQESDKMMTDLKEEVKILRTRPNQTPFNPSLKEFLKDTPAENKRTPMSLYKRIRTRLEPNYDDITAELFVPNNSETPTRATSTPINVGVKQSIEIDSPLDVAAFDLPMAPVGDDKRRLRAPKLAASKRPDGFGDKKSFGGQKTLSKLTRRPLKCSVLTLENAATADANDSIIILD